MADFSVLKIEWGSKFGTTKCKWPTFRNFEISNIKKTKVELLDFIFSNLFLLSHHIRSMKKEKVLFTFTFV